MDYRKVIYSYFFSGIVLLLLSSCSNQNNELEDVLSHCSIGFKMSDFSEIQEYYDRIITDKFEFIAFKEFTYTGIRLVSLIIFSDRSFLSISLPAIKNGTLYKKIPLENAQKILNKFSTITKIDNYNGGNSFHPRCFLVTIKTSEVKIVSGLLNPRTYFLGSENYKSNGLKIYTSLLLLIKEYFPDYDARSLTLVRANSDIVTINNKIFNVDTYIAATHDEKKEFTRKLFNDPFFEINDSVKQP